MSIKYDNGDSYEGATEGGKRHGRGTYACSDGAKFTGEWKNDLLFGMGTYSGSDGTYEGEWEESLKQGKGEFKWPTGDWYRGAWISDNMNGEGQYGWSNGKLYDGFFRDGQRNGLGTLKFPDGTKYEGEFRNDRCEGYGRLYEQNGGVYEGEWKDNKKFGKGVYTYPDGRKYDGEWLNDKKTTGIVINADGSKIKVTFNPDGSVASSEAVTEAPPPPAKADPSTVANTTYASWLKEPTAEEKKSKVSGICSWLDMNASQREEHKASALALSFGGEPSSYVRGGASGTHYFRKAMQDDQAAKLSGKAPESIPYEELKLPSQWNRPDIDILKRETYLSDSEFQAVFKTDKATFSQMPLWKQNAAKKAVKLF